MVGQTIREVLGWRETLNSEVRAKQQFERRSGQFADRQLYQGRFKDRFD